MCAGGTATEVSQTSWVGSARYGVQGGVGVRVSPPLPHPTNHGSSQDVGEDMAEGRSSLGGTARDRFAHRPWVWTRPCLYSPPWQSFGRVWGPHLQLGMRGQQARPRHTWHKIGTRQPESVTWLQRRTPPSSTSPHNIWSSKPWMHSQKSSEVISGLRSILDMGYLPLTDNCLLSQFSTCISSTYDRVLQTSPS